MRSDEVHIRFYYVPKYCYECKMEGHDKYECRILNNLKGDGVAKESEDKGKEVEKGKDIHIEKEDKKLEKEANANISEIPWIHYFQKGKARVLSSGKVVIDPGSWSVVKDNRYAVLVEKKLTYIIDKYSNAYPTKDNGNNPVITSNSKIRRQKGSSEVHVVESAKFWVLQAFGPSPKSQTKSPIDNSSSDGPAQQIYDDQAQQSTDRKKEEQVVKPIVEIANDANGCDDDTNVVRKAVANEANVCMGDRDADATLLAHDANVTDANIDKIMEDNVRT
uniref:Uncharacterized protein n=1 Tax=Solanum tuberosum TaxID=4113 RepID=M1DGW7_SOLTU